MNNHNYYFSSDANINTTNMDYVYDQRLPESLEKLNQRDIVDDDNLISTDSVKLFLENLNLLLLQFPRINPPNLIPIQTFVIDNEMQNLISNVTNNKKTANAATSTNDIITSTKKN